MASRPFQSGEVVTNCDHPGFLLRRELQNEIVGKSLPIAFYRLIQGLGRHAIEFRQIGVDCGFLAPDHQDPLLDPLYRDDSRRFGHEMHSPKALEFRWTFYKALPKRKRILFLRGHRRICDSRHSVGGLRNIPRNKRRASHVETGAPYRATAWSRW